MTLPPNIIGVDVAKNWLDVFYLATAKAERIAMPKQSLTRFSKGAKSCLVVLQAFGGYERPLTEALTRFKTGFSGANPRDRQAGQNRPGQSVNAWIRTQITSHINAMVGHRKAVGGEIAKLMAADKTLAAGNLRLQSMPGIGPTIAAMLQARLPELCQLDRRKLANFAGLAPHATESGQHRGKRRTRGGRADPTRALYLGGFVASRCDPTLRAHREKLQAAGKPTKVAIISCARKLLTILAAMMRDQTDSGDKKPASKAVADASVKNRLGRGEILPIPDRRRAEVRFFAATGNRAPD